jgi:hypothetical protein
MRVKLVFHVHVNMFMAQTHLQRVQGLHTIVQGLLLQICMHPRWLLHSSTCLVMISGGYVVMTNRSCRQAAALSAWRWML